MLPTNNVKTSLVSLAFSSINTRSQMVTRNTEVNLTQHNANAIQDIIAQEGELSLSALNASIPTVTSASMTPEKRAVIPNGWQTQRFRFVLVLETSRLDGSVMRTYVTGYTDTPQASVKSANYVLFAPELIFIVNNVIEVVGMVNSVGKYSWVPKAAYNVVQDLNGNTYYEDDKDLVYLMRPMDFITTLSADTSGHNYQSLTGTVSANAETAAHTNRDTNTGLVNICNAVSRASAATMGSYDVVSSTMSEAKGTLIEANVYNNPFIEILSELDNKHVTSDAFLRTSFTITDLTTINGGPLGQKVAADVNAGAKNNGVVIGELSTLESTSIEAKLTTDLINILSSLLWRYKITLFSFMMTNDIAQTQMVFGQSNTKIAVSACFSIIEGSDTMKLTKLMEHEMQTVFARLVPPGEAMTLTVDANLLGITTVSIKLTNRRQQTFEVPTFADNTFTNLKGSNEAYSNVSNAINKITGELI